MVVSRGCLEDCLFFFFQAEDGIRDVAVTGVQTCALPIYTTASMRISGVFHTGDAQGFVATIVSYLPLRARQAADGSTRLTKIEEHTSELQSRLHLVCRLLLEKKKKNTMTTAPRRPRSQHPSRVHHA